MALFDQVGARWVVVGADFTYGARRAGTVETLRAAAARARGRGGCRAHRLSRWRCRVVEPGARVHPRGSRGGGGAAAGATLRSRWAGGSGERPRTHHRVSHGQRRHRGTSCARRAGVYAVRVRAPRPRGPAGAARPTSGSSRPSGAAEVTIEAHLFDFSGDLYGQRLQSAVHRAAAARAELRVGHRAGRADRPRRGGARREALLRRGGQVL